MGLTRRIITTQENLDFCKRNYTTTSLNLDLNKIPHYLTD